MLPVESSILKLGATAAGAAAASYLMGFAVRRFLRLWQIVDNPNERSSHSEPTPRGGGIGIMLVIWSGAILLLPGGGGAFTWVAVGASVILAAVSFIDDRFSVSWRIRISVQLILAIIVVVGLWLIREPVTAGLSLAIFPLLAFLLIAYTNAFNFMDGINGLAAGQALLTGVGTAAIAIAAGAPPTAPAVGLALLLAGAAGGFLPHNFPRARMFMGDVGSVPLGFLLAVLSAWIACSWGWRLLVPFALLHSNFIMDTGITLVRRLWRGEVLHQAHRQHFYQRLTQAGWTHTAVTRLEGLLQVIVLVIVVAIAAHTGTAVIRIAAAASIVLLWALFFSFCERTYRRSIRTDPGSRPRPGFTSLKP